MSLSPHTDPQSVRIVMHVRAHTHTHTHTCVYTHMCTHTCVHTLAPNQYIVMHTHIHAQTSAYAHTYTHTRRQSFQFNMDHSHFPENLDFLFPPPPPHSIYILWSRYPRNNRFLHKLILRQYFYHELCEPWRA
jgi:hypothetical protein